MRVERTETPVGGVKRYLVSSQGRQANDDVILRFSARLSYAEKYPYFFPRCENVPHFVRAAHTRNNTH